LTCARLEEVLTSAPSAEALAHAKTCEECGPARAAWEAMGRTAPGEESALRRTRMVALQELERQPAARAWWVDALVLLTVNLAIATAASSMFEWHGTQHDSLVTRWGVAGGLLVLMAVGAWAAIQPGMPLVRIGVLAFAAMLAMWAGLGGSGVGPDVPLWSGRNCALIEVGLSVIPLSVVLWATTRFAFDFTRALTGGASIAATGMLVLHLHCPNGLTSHLLLFHVAPWLGLVLLTLLARRLMPSRSYAP
jgi:hypothetical protein